MTLSFNANLSQANKKQAITPVTMSAIALMAFLLLFLTSTLAHADHLIEQSVNVEQQECYICHQCVDTPPEQPQVQVVAVTSYQLKPQKILTVTFKASGFVQPQLRAPPIHQ